MIDSMSDCSSIEYFLVLNQVKVGIDLEAARSGKGLGGGKKSGKLSHGHHDLSCFCKGVAVINICTFIFSLNSQTLIFLLGVEYSYLPSLLTTRMSYYQGNRKENL